MFTAIVLATAMLGQAPVPADQRDVDWFRESPYLCVEDSGKIDPPKVEKKVATIKKHITHVRTDPKLGYVICKWNVPPTKESINAVRAVFERVVPYYGQVPR